MCFNRIMVTLRDFTRISIYASKNKRKERPLERLYALGQQSDRSLNYMVVVAISDYLKSEEKKAK